MVEQGRLAHGGGQLSAQHAAVEGTHEKEKEREPVGGRGRPAGVALSLLLLGQYLLSLAWPLLQRWGLLGAVTLL